MTTTSAATIRTGRKLRAEGDWADWRAVLTAAGVRLARVHDARHTAARLLLEQGIDIRVVQQILGHSQLRMTERQYMSRRSSPSSPPNEWARPCGDDSHAAPGQGTTCIALEA